MTAASNGAKELFLRALAHASPEEQDAFVAAACPQDADLRTEVKGLLRAHREAGRFLCGAPAASAATSAYSAGHRIGPYTLVKEIGAGGMGVVWLARQHEPVERRVALKLLRPGSNSEQVIARFALEREALARMDHPHIARVLDAGMTETGTPFFVMELVEGVFITRYCDERRLSVPQRLTLFMAVCQAVQHAHQKGVIHRDLKPSNVLVAEFDGNPMPKVIDFGIARAIGEETSGQTRFTLAGQFIGTPQYMAPEQADFNPSDADTRCDIYALGVLLFELLVGATPFDRSRVRPASLGEWLQTIREQDAPPPSQCLPEHEEGRLIASQRSSDPGQLRRRIRGDLDWIVLKCLDKDRARRYASAGSLADDVRRHLEGLPVEARRPSPWYRAGKFVARNRLAVLAAASVAALLVGGLVASGVVLYQVHAAAVKEHEAGERLRGTLYYSDMSGAHEAWRDSDLRRMEQLLRRHVPKPGQDDFRGFDWYYLWRLLESTRTTTLTMPFKVRTAIYAPPRGETIAVGLMDGRVELYDRVTHKPVKSLGSVLAISDHPTRLSFSRDGAKLAFQNSRHAIVCNLNSGQEASFHAPNLLDALALSADGRFLAGGTNTGHVYVWDLSQSRDEPKWTFDLSPAKRVQCLAFTHQGHRLAASGDRNPIHIFNLDDADPAASRHRVKSDSYPAAGTIAYSPDDRILAAPANDQSVHIFDTRTWKRLGRLVHSEEVYAVAFSSTGEHLATVTGSGALYYWKFGDREPLWMTPAHTGVAFSVSLSPDDRTILTAGTDRTIRLWPVKRQSAERHLRIEEATRLNQLSARGTHLISVRGFNNRTLRVVNLSDWKETPLAIPGLDNVLTAAVSPQDAIAVSLRDGRLLLIRDLGKSFETLPLSSTVPAGISALRFSPNGKHLAIGRENGEVTLWDLARAQPQFQLKDPARVYTLRFTNNGLVLAAGKGHDIVCWQQSPTSPDSWVEVRRLQGHWAAVNAIEFHPQDDGLLASGSGDDTVKLWRWQTTAPPRTLSGHMGSVSSLAFSPDGKLLVSGGRDATVAFWDVATGERRMHLKQEGPLIGQVLTFTPDGRKLLSGDWGRWLYAWEAASQQEARKAGW